MEAPSDWQCSCGVWCGAFQSCGKSGLPAALLLLFICSVSSHLIASHFTSFHTALSLSLLSKFTLRLTVLPSPHAAVLLSYKHVKCAHVLPNAQISPKLSNW